MLIDAELVGRFLDGSVAAIMSERARFRSGARGARAPRPHPARGQLDHRGARSSSLHAHPDPDVAYDLLLARAARRHALIAEFFESRQACRARRSARSRATGATRQPSTRGRPARAAAAQAERGWAKDHAVLLYRQALELVPEATRSAGASSGGAWRSRPRRRSISAMSDGRKSAGVTSPAISSIEATSCLPSRSECSTTMSAVGAS